MLTISLLNFGLKKSTKMKSKRLSMSLFLRDLSICSSMMLLIVLMKAYQICKKLRKPKKKGIFQLFLHKNFKCMRECWEVVLISINNQRKLSTSSQILVFGLPCPSFQIVNIYFSY